MFEFLHKKRDGTIVDVVKAICESSTRIQLSGLAQEKAADLIANAVSKCEVVVYDGHRRIKNNVYYRLNIQPNDNQTGTDFWYCAVHRLMKYGECLIVNIKDQFFIADSFNVTSNVMYPKTYRNVTITDGIDIFNLGRTFSAREVLHLRYRNNQLAGMTNRVLRIYDEMANAIYLAETIGKTPKFKFKANAGITFREKTATGEDRRLTITDVVDNTKRLLKSSDIEVLREADGTEISYLGINSGISASEFVTISDAVNRECAMVYGIPKGVFFGEITEQSDATNEFLTYAVQPVVEIINDSLNAKYVGMDSYINGESIFVWLANFKHIDPLDAAVNIDKLRSNGWTLDETRKMVGYEELNTDFSTDRALTKNYAAEGDGEGENAEDRAEERVINKPKLSKHKERRKKREQKQEMVSAC